MAQGGWRHKCTNRHYAISQPSLIHLPELNSLSSFSALTITHIEIGPCPAPSPYTPSQWRASIPTSLARWAGAASERCILLSKPPLVPIFSSHLSFWWEKLCLFHWHRAQEVPKDPHSRGCTSGRRVPIDIWCLSPTERGWGEQPRMEGMHNTPKSHKISGNSPMDEEEEVAQTGCIEWAHRDAAGAQHGADAWISIMCGSHTPLGKDGHPTGTGKGPRSSCGSWHQRLWVTGQGRGPSRFQFRVLHFHAPR